MHFPQPQRGSPRGQLRPGELLLMAARLPKASTVRAIGGLDTTLSGDESAVVAEAQRDIQMRGIRPAPGLPLPHGVPSHGSLVHGSGRCRPCMWFWKPTGCTRGEDCLHCHLCPQTTREARKKLQRREARRELAKDGPVVAERPAAQPVASSGAANFSPSSRPSYASLSRKDGDESKPRLSLQSNPRCSASSRPSYASLNSKDGDESKPRLSLQSKPRWSLQSLDTSVGSAFGEDQSSVSSPSPPESPRQVSPAGLMTPPGVFYISF